LQKVFQREEQKVVIFHHKAANFQQKQLRGLTIISLLPNFSKMGDFQPQILYCGKNFSNKGTSSKKLKFRLDGATAHARCPYHVTSGCQPVIKLS